MCRGARADVGIILFGQISYDDRMMSMDAKQLASEAILAALTDAVAGRELPVSAGDLSYDSLADELAELLIPLAARGADYQALLAAGTAKLDGMAEMYRLSATYRVADCAAEAVRETITPVAAPDSLRMLVSLLPLLCPDSESAEQVGQFLTDLATRPAEAGA